MKKLLLLFCLLTPALEKGKIENEFTEHSTLTATKVVEVSDIYMQFPMLSYLSESSIIVGAVASNFSSDDNIAVILSTNTGKVIKGLIKGGRGPLELGVINNLGQQGDSIIYFFDAMSQKMINYDITADKISYAKINFGKYSGRNLFMVNDTKYVSVGRFENNMYCYGDKLSGDQKFFLAFPPLPDTKNDDNDKYVLARSYAFQGGILKHPYLPMLAYFTINSARIQWVEAKNEKIEETHQWVYSMPKGKLRSVNGEFLWDDDRDTPRCFIGGTASSKYIYLIYTDQPEGYEKGNQSNLILVFDWEGQKVKTIHLDREIEAIAVDPKDKTLIGWGINDKTMYNEISTYQLQ